MGLATWDTRSFELQSRARDLGNYLDKIEELARDELAKEDTGATKEKREGWRAIFEAWKEKMKTALADGIKEDHVWRRIIFLMEEFKFMIPRELQPVLNRVATDVAPGLLPRTVKSIVQAKPHSRIPHWVDDSKHALPVSLTFQRLSLLSKRLESMKKEMNESRRPGYRWTVLSRWVQGVEGVMIYHVHIDGEWERILFMLDDMQKRFREKENLLNNTSGEIDAYFTGPRMLKSLTEPWGRFRDFDPANHVSPPSRVEASQGKSRRISSRVASRHGIQTQGVAEEGGSYF